jgi:hypothetical protein
MDLGLSVTWYDLEPGIEAGFIAWLHSTYLPRLKQHPGIAWVSHYKNEGGGGAMRELHRIALRPNEVVPSGCQYLLLVGAPSPQVFFDPTLIELDLADDLKEKLTLRRRLRTEIYAEQARVDGAASPNRIDGSTSAPAIQLGCYRMKDVQAEVELGRWYVQHRFPLMSQMRACVRTRKLLSVVGWAKHGVLYEFESLEARLKNHEEPHESKVLDPATPTGTIVQNCIYPPGSPFIGERIWPSLK